MRRLCHEFQEITDNSLCGLYMHTHPVYGIWRKIIYDLYIGTEWVAFKSEVLYTVENVLSIF